MDKLREKVQEIRNCKYSYEGYRPIIHPKLLEIIEMETFKNNNFVTFKSENFNSTTQIYYETFIWSKLHIWISIKSTCILYSCNEYWIAVYLYSQSDWLFYYYFL